MLTHVTARHILPIDNRTFTVEHGDDGRIALAVQVCNDVPLWTLMTREQSESLALCLLARKRKKPRTKAQKLTHKRKRK